MNPSLRQYLSSVSKAGVFESTGRFTVDVQKRRMKLRENLFLHPTHAILCCVRAGVTSGAERVSITQEHRQTRVEFRNPKDLDPRELLEGVLGEGQGAETERLLGAAFQGTFSNGCERVEIELPGALVSLTPTDMDVEPREEVEGERFCRIVFRYGSDRVANRKRCAQEGSAVYVRAAFCPVPLFLDGMQVSGGLGWEGLFQWQQSSDYSVPKDFVWMEAMLGEIGEPFPATPSQHKFRLEFLAGQKFESLGWSLERGSAFLRVMPKTEPGRLRVCTLTRLGSLLDGPGYLYPLKQGVILEPVEENLGAPALGVVVRADHLDTDLSLFQLRQDRGYEKLVRNLQVQGRVLVSRLMQNQKSFALNKEGSLGRGVASSLKWGFGTALLLAPSGPWGSLFGGLGALCVAGLVHTLLHGDLALTNREKQVRGELSNYGRLVKFKGAERLRL